MFTAEQTPEQVIADLRSYGLELFVGEDGIVHGRFREKGKRMTLEMRAAADRLQAMNDQVAALLRAEPEKRRLEGVTVEELKAEWGPKLAAGEWKLEGKVIYHRSTGLCDLTLAREATA